MTLSAAPPRTGCEFRCLGTVSLAGPAGSMPLRTRKQIALLLFLARRAGRPAARDELIELLWSEDDEKGARHSLSQSASLMNKTLGAEVICSAGRDRMVVAPGALWLDVNEFERCAADGRHEEALSLWRGTLFEGTWIRRAPNFERWLGEERDRLQRIFRRIAHGRLEALRTSGSHSSMRDQAERLLQLEPLDEKAMLVHLEALTLTDDRSLALRRYREFEQRLRRELDAEPGSALRSWAKRHRRGDGGSSPGRHLPLPRISEVTVLPTPQPLFGRTEEFAMLWDAWEQAKVGRGSFIILEGEAGIGKTALATKLVNQAHVAGGSVCFVKCYRTEKSVPFAPVTALIRQLCRLPGFVALDPVWIGELTRLVPELRDRYPGAPQPMAVDDAARHRLSDATVQAALAVADELPLMIVVDDLQDADEASLAVVHYLSRQRETQILMLGAHRIGNEQSDYEKTFLDTARAGHLARFFKLGGLARVDVEKLIQQVAANRGTEAHSGTIASVASLSRGNPLRAIEAAHAVLSPSQGDTQRARLDESPSTVAFDTTAIERFGALSSAAKYVAGALAVAGHPLTEFELADVTLLKPADLAMALTVLADNLFVARFGARIGLAHELYSSAIESGLPANDRKALHVRLARLLARAAANSPAVRFEAARHFDAAGRARSAGTHARAAARFAALVGAVRSEAEALELVSRVSEAGLSDVGFRLGHCYLELNEFEKLAKLCEVMAADKELTAGSACELAYLQIAAAAESGGAPMTELEDRLREVLTRRIGFPHQRSAQVLLIRVADKTGNYSLARETARSLRQSREYPRADRFALFAAGYVFSRYYTPSRSLPLLQCAILEAQEQNDWATENLCRACIGIALKQTGRFRESIAQFNLSIALAHKTMNPNGEARSLQNRAVSEIALGDWPTVFATLDEADALPHASWAFRTYNEFNRAIAWFFAGDYYQAFDLFSRARTMARRHALITMVADSTAGMSLASLRLGREQEFAELGAEAVQIESPAQPSRVGWLLPSVHAWLQARVGGETDRAIESLASQSRRAKRRDTAFWLSIELERVLLLEHVTSRKADLDRRALLSEAVKYEANAIAAACG